MPRFAPLSVLAVCLLLAAPAARAETYAADLPMEDEADLRALREDGLLGPEDFEMLRELLRSGVDVRTASREALYTLPGLTWAQVEALLAYRARAREAWALEELVEAGVLTAEALRRMRPFVREAAREARTVSGRLRLLGARVGEAPVPPVVLLAQVTGPWGLRAGAGLSLTPHRLGLAHDGTREVPRLHVRWEGERASVLVGAFRLGFGQRLTLDTTGRPAPEGFVPDEAFILPGDAEPRGGREGFRGVVGTVRGRVEDVSLAFTGFGASPSRPDAVHALAVGGHAAVGFSSRARLGLTAWGAWPRWPVGGQTRDVGRGSAGAVGLEGAWGAGPVNLFFEGVTPLTGGLGALQRTVLGDRRRELELTLRYASEDFDNPSGRAPSRLGAADGRRTRDELGARLRYLHRTEDGAWRLVGEVDVWRPPSGGGGPVHLRTSARVGFLGVPGLEPSVWGAHSAPPPGQAGAGGCPEDSLAEDATIPCTGMGSLAAGRVRINPAEGLGLVAQYQHAWLGGRRRPGGLAQQGRGTLETILQPLPSLRLRVRTGWQDEVLADGSRVTRALRTSAELAWALLPALGTRVRYELAWERRAAGDTRAPSEPPRHLLRLELEGRL